MMTRLGWPFGYLVFLGLMPTSLSVAQNDKPAKPKRPEPKIMISKETTWATEPLREDGFIDYLEAVNRRFSQGVTTENNAAVLLYQALGPAPDGTRQPDRFFRRLGIEPLPDEGTYWQKSGDWGEALMMASARPWKSSEFPNVADWLQKNEAALRIVAEATERPRYFSPLVTSDAKPDAGMIDVLLPGVQMSRDLGRALAARAMKHLAEGSQLDAWRDLMALHRLGRLVGQGPTLIEFLVGVAIESMAINGEQQFLSVTKPSAKLLTMYRKQLDRLPSRANVADKLDVAERIMFLDSATRIARGKITLHAIANGDGDESLVEKLAAGVIVESVDWDELLKSANKWYDRLVDATRQPDYHARAGSLKKFDQDLKDLVAKRRSPTGLLALLAGKPAVTQTMSDVLISLLLPAVTQVVSAESRATQRIRNLEVAFALAIYRADHEAYPDSLDQLVPKYLATEPKDLFSGRSLRYERTAEGYRFYSIGPNEKDDNGQSTEDVPRGDDIVVQMPVPTKAN